MPMAIVAAIAGFTMIMIVVGVKARAFQARPNTEGFLGGEAGAGGAPFCALLGTDIFSDGLSTLGVSVDVVTAASLSPPSVSLTLGVG